MLVTSDEKNSMKKQGQNDISLERTSLRQVNMIDMMFVAKRKPELQIRQEIPIQEQSCRKLNTTGDPGELDW